MKRFRLLLVLLLPAFGWWCETSNRHGCRGQSRHFVREAAVANPFLAFEDIKISYMQLHHRLLHLDVFLGSSAVAGPDGCEDDVYICKLQVPLVDDAADLH